MYIYLSRLIFCQSLIFFSENNTGLAGISLEINEELNRIINLNCALHQMKFEMLSLP